MLHIIGGENAAVTGRLSNKAAFLDKLSFTRHCSESDRRHLLDACSLLTYKPAQTLIWEAERSPSALLLAGGKLRVLLIGPKGREIQLYRVDEGGACAANLMSVLNGTVSMVHIVAETAATVLAVSPEHFHDLMHTSACFHRFVMEKIHSGMTSTISMLKNMAFVRVEERVADFFIERIADGNGSSEIRTTHAAIATEIGTAREVISRVLKQFEKAGAIEVKRGRVIIKSLGSLRAYNTPKLVAVQ